MLKPAAERIEKGLWWDKAWSLVEGCTPLSDGCRHCWAAREAQMRAKNPNAKVAAANAGLTADGCFDGTVRFRTDLLDLPLKRRKPTVYAVWNDLFHEAIEQGTIADALIGMTDMSRHGFFVLTKRPERFQWVVGEVAARCTFAPRSAFQHVWLGTTVENQAAANERLPHMAYCWPFQRFLSVEPLLESVTLDLTHVDWVIVGGESGAGARRCEEEWIRGVVGQCRAAGVACFVKQMGSVWAKTKVHTNCTDWSRGLGWRPEWHTSVGHRSIIGMKGQNMQAWPVDLRVREWPE